MSTFTTIPKKNCHDKFSVIYFFEQKNFIERLNLKNILTKIYVKLCFQIEDGPSLEKKTEQTQSQLPHCIVKLSLNKV